MALKNSKEAEKISSFPLFSAKVLLGLFLLGTTTGCIDEYIKDMRLENPLGGPKADMTISYGENELLDGEDVNDDESLEGAAKRHKKRRKRHNIAEPTMMMPVAPPGASFEEEEGEGGKTSKGHGRRSVTPSTEVNYGDGDE